MLPEVRMARIIDAIGLHQARKLSCGEAAELLGMSERPFRRLRDAYEAHGAEGIVGGSWTGGAGGPRAGAHRSTRSRGWLRSSAPAPSTSRPSTFTKRSGAGRWRTESRLSEATPGPRACCSYGGSSARRRGARPTARSGRAGRCQACFSSRTLLFQDASLPGRFSSRTLLFQDASLPGRFSSRTLLFQDASLPGRFSSRTLLFQDGSKHAWLPQGPELDLVVTMDDATSAILSAVLVEEEGTASSFVGLKEVIAAHGLFSAFYTDRGSHYFYTPKVGEPVDNTRLTQVGRALKQLGIEHIPSDCPEGRGRMERLFGTLQSRLPPLMRQEGLASIEAANRWLATVYVPQHNARFAVLAAEEGTAFVPFVGVLDDILCVQDERVVRNDNTVRYEGRVLQIPEQRHRRHFVKATVRVHDYPDGRLAIFHGPRWLADSHPDGSLINQARPARTAA